MGLMGLFSSPKPKPEPAAQAAPMPLAETAELEANNETKKAIKTENNNSEIDFDEWGNHARENPKWLRQLDNDGYTPLHLASGKVGVEVEEFEIILKLYPGGAKIRSSHLGEIPLAFAANNPHGTKKTEMLINAFPGGIYVKDTDGKTAYDTLEARKRVIENTYKSGNRSRGFIQSMEDFKAVYEKLKQLLKPPDNAVGGSRKRKRKTRRNKKNRKSRKSRKYKK